MFEQMNQVFLEELKKVLKPIIHEIADEVISEAKHESNIPYTFDKPVLKKYFFPSIDLQTITTHIIDRADFPKFKVGTRRIVFHRDMVIDWIDNHQKEVLEAAMISKQKEVS